jgi:hypothetical protein|tara:strand:- start:181 stop:390 length:210 start_codon:yes stop_codon:yes gene_type:complete
MKNTNIKLLVLWGLGECIAKYGLHKFLVILTIIVTFGSMLGPNNPDTLKNLVVGLGFLFFLYVIKKTNK